MLSFWDIGEGYDKYDDGVGISFLEKVPDQYCFKDRRTEINCLDKKKYFAAIDGYPSGKITYNLRGTSFYLNEHGNIVEIKNRPDSFR